MKRRSLMGLVGALAVVAPLGAASALETGGTTTAAAAVVSIVHRPIMTVGVRHDQVSSTNWSGYSVSSTTQFTDVVGTWTEPTATCGRGSTTYGSFWAGIDGYSSDSVEQIGTDADCVQGTPSYYAWWEMYPAGSVDLPTTTYPVKAGDTLTAEVNRLSATSTTYTLTLKSSEGWKFSTTATGRYANSSAEWVAEAPELCSRFFCSLASLTDFGTVSFSGMDAAAGGADAAASTFTAGGGPHEMTMVSDFGVIKAQPSPLATANGASAFSDTWNHS